jgi:hypothetical protein
VYPVLVRELLPKIGFAWTTRVLGFLNLGLLSIAFTFMRPRLPPRSTGPIVDWKAFTEPVFVLFVAGIFFMLWNVYFTFYYVSLSSWDSGTRSRTLISILQIASYGIEQVGLPYTASTSLVMIINGVGYVQTKQKPKLKRLHQTHIKTNTPPLPDSPSASSHPSSPTNSAPSTPSAQSSSA